MSKYKDPYEYIDGFKTQMSSEDVKFWYSDRILTDEECKEIHNDKSRLHWTGTPIYNQIYKWLRRKNDSVETRPAPQINTGSSYNYTSPIDGKQITNREQHQAHMREHDVVEVGNEYKDRISEIKGEEHI